jgi:hypothetical protein
MRNTYENVVGNPERRVSLEDEIMDDRIILNDLR